MGKGVSGNGFVESTIAGIGGIGGIGGTCGRDVAGINLTLLLLGCRDSDFDITESRMGVGGLEMGDMRSGCIAPWNRRGCRLVPELLTEAVLPFRECTTEPMPGVCGRLLGLTENNPLEVREMVGRGS